MQQPSNRTEAILLTGFLGSGKTTLLNHMLSWYADLSDTVVIMNDFGEICIDGMLIQKNVEMVELANGCICCTLQLDLRKQIEILVDRFHPRWLILEATGLADSKSLVDVFAEYIEKALLTSYRLVAVIDAQIWPMRHLLGPVFSRQLEYADLILLNKIDTLNAETIDHCLQEIAAAYPQASTLKTAYCGIDQERLGEMKAFKSPPPAIFHEHKSVHDSTQGWTSVSFVEECPLEEEKFRRFLQNTHEQVFRLKGVVQFPNRAAIINHVHGVSEWTETTPGNGTKLVIIRRRTD